MATKILSVLTDTSPTTLVISAVSLLLAVVIANEFRSWWRLRHVPGPFWNSISVFPLAKTATTGRYSHHLKAIQSKYGPLVRIGPDLVMFADAETYRRLNGVRSEFTKGPWYHGARMVPGQDSIFTSTDEVWRKDIRTKMTPGYAGKEGAAFEPKVDQMMLQLIDLIERKYISTPTEYRPVDFAHRIMFFSLDVLGEISFGEAFGFLREDKDMYNYLEINDGFVPILGLILTIPWLDGILKSWPFSMALPKDGDEIGFGRLMGLANDIVDKRFTPGAEPRNDMLESHIRNGLTKQELLAEIFLELVAAVDSTATTIRMILLHLLATPSSLTTLLHEIDTAIATSRISSTIITDAEASRLPYLQAVIKEGLRLFPPATGGMNKQPPKGGAEIHGYFLPEGTQIAVNILALTHDTRVFGEDAEVFRPERWIEGDEGRIAEMGKAVELVFGYGRYQCMGMRIAYMEINKVVVELLRRFDFAVVNPLEPLKVYDAAFWVCKDFHLRVTKRVPK